MEGPGSVSGAAPPRAPSASGAVPGPRRGGGGGSIMVSEPGPESGRGPCAALGGLCALPRPSGAPAAGAGRSRCRSRHPLGTGGARVKARPRRGPRGLCGAGNARPGPVRFGSVRVGLCVGFGVSPPDGVVLVRGGPGGPGVPPEGLHRLRPAPSHCGSGRTFTRPPSSPALCRGNAHSKSCICYACQGTSLKLAAGRKKKTGFGCLVTGAVFVLL